jgi:signal transduction histidine kinase
MSGTGPTAPATAAPSSVPRSFRRESRLFLWVALLLILFLNFSTLLFFRHAVDWGSRTTERRAAEILRQIALSSGTGDSMQDAMERSAAAEPDLIYLAAYDANGRRVQDLGRAAEAPALLPTERPAPGGTVSVWRRKPALLVTTLATPKHYLSAGLDPGAGAGLREYARALTLFLPLSAVILTVLAALYLRSLLAPYERLLAAAGTAPAPDGAARDEREFLVARFETAIAALREKEQELQRLALSEKERADDLELAARTLSRHLPTGLLSIDPRGVVVELNEAAREILRLSGDRRGHPYPEVLSDVSEFRALIAEVFETRIAEGRREIRWSGAGEERVLGATATPAEGAEGKFLGVIALFSDLTEIRKLEARVALVRHMADLGEVSAGAAHEFRNAAAAIDGYADLALRSPDPARAAEHLKAIRREAQEMSRVSSDFLLFARPEGFVPEEVDLSVAAEAAVAETQRAFPDLSIESGGELPVVRGSAVLLRRALANLLRNAAEATPAERRREPLAVTLWGERRGSEVILSVADHGAGVPPSDREKVFLPFYSTKPGGAGFGLAIVARIADLHGGTVEVSDGPSGGAVFTLRLPA